MIDGIWRMKVGVFVVFVVFRMHSICLGEIFVYVVP